MQHLGFKLYCLNLFQFIFYYGVMMNSVFKRYEIGRYNYAMIIINTNHAIKSLINTFIRFLVDSIYYETQGILDTAKFIAED
jgi:hypothetical protein